LGDIRYPIERRAEAARAVGQQIQVLRANTEREIDAAFETAKEKVAKSLGLTIPPGVLAIADEVIE
jgi:hypothetical protein